MVIVECWCNNIRCMVEENGKVTVGNFTKCYWWSNNRESMKTRNVGNDSGGYVGGSYEW